MNLVAYSLDTSVVMRLLTGKPTDQFEKAMTFLSDAQNEGKELFVTDLVLAESYYALQAYYGLPKDKALTALNLFAESSGVTVSDTARASLRTPNLSTKKPGFVDRLIHGQSHSQKHLLVTFEKAANKLPGTQLLK